MSDRSKSEDPDASSEEAGADGAGTEESGGETGRRGFSEGLRQGLGVLSALKDAIEETISEARERGDLSADRARQAVKGALGRAQSAAGEARERFDFPLQKDFDALVARVEAIEQRLGMEARPASEPTPETATDQGEGHT